MGWRCQRTGAILSAIRLSVVLASHVLDNAKEQPTKRSETAKRKVNHGHAINEYVFSKEGICPSAAESSSFKCPIEKEFNGTFINLKMKYKHR